MALEQGTHLLGLRAVGIAAGSHPIGRLAVRQGGGLDAGRQTELSESLTEPLGVRRTAEGGDLHHVGSTGRLIYLTSYLPILPMSSLEHGH